jgi:VIT1/CCC1 family predicted Fe2+/Mn2+ transporter
MREKGVAIMGMEEVKAAIKDLSVEERRKVALYIFELEKDQLQKRIGPQITEDLEGFSRVVQETVEKLRKLVNKS